MVRQVTLLMLLATAPAAAQTPMPRPATPDTAAKDKVCAPVSGGDFAHRQYAMPLSIADAEKILVCTTRLELGLAPPRLQGYAFNVLIERPDAVARFRSIAGRGGAPAKLYALAAFLIISPSEADALAAELQRDTRKLGASDNDIVIPTRTMSDLVAFVRLRQLGQEFRRNQASIAAFFQKKQ